MKNKLVDLFSGLPVNIDIQSEFANPPFYLYLTNILSAHLLIHNYLYK